MCNSSLIICACLMCLLLACWHCRRDTACGWSFQVCSVVASESGYCFEHQCTSLIDRPDVPKRAHFRNLSSPLTSRGSSLMSRPCWTPRNNVWQFSLVDLNWWIRLEPLQKFKKFSFGNKSKMFFLFLSTLLLKIATRKERYRSTLFISFFFSPSQSWMSPTTLSV